METKGVVLIADDNENNLRVLSTMLREAGYQVRVANNGAQVLRSVALSLPDLILLDIHMPVMDGYQTCEKLKSEADTAAIPVIFISALTETFNKVKAFETGGVDYITKPFQVEEVRVRVKTHLTLRRQTLELEQALKEIREVQVKLVQAEKMASLGVLSAGIAHEINNPNNFVYVGINSLIKQFSEVEKALSELLPLCSQHPDLQAEAERIVSRFKLNHRMNTIQTLAGDIKTGAVRTTEIIKGLRLFTRSDQEEKTSGNLADFIQAALLLLKNQYKNKAEVILNMPEQMAPISCYPGLLTQALVNILHNAFDAISEKGRVEITVKQENEWTTIKISDNGKGMDAEVRSKIFDPFFTTKDVGGGMGLGLSITHGIIGKHGGNISVESTPGQGSEFDIEIPSASA